MREMEGDVLSRDFATALGHRFHFGSHHVSVAFQLARFRRSDAQTR